MKTKICSHCQENKPIEEFWKQKGRDSASWCKRCLYDFQIERWRSKKKKAVELLGGKCVKCGYSKNVACLHFHHIDSNDKEFNWSKLRLRSWDKIILELKKCKLLCSICHTELHYPEDEVSNNPDTSNIMLNVGPISSGICPQCNAEVYGTTYCSQKCSQIGRRKVIRPSKEELKELICHHSFVDIGKKYHVSDTTVRKWAKQYDLI